MKFRKYGLTLCKLWLQVTYTMMNEARVQKEVWTPPSSI